MAGTEGAGDDEEGTLVDDVCDGVGRLYVSKLGNYPRLFRSAQHSASTPSGRTLPSHRRVLLSEFLLRRH